MGMDKVAKAIVGALLAGYAVYEIATTTSSAGGDGVTSAEWVHVGVSAVVAGLAVWAVPNAPDRKL